MRRNVKSQSFKPSPRKSPTSGANGEIEAACRALFDAYDVDESGELDREEYLKIEMRLMFEKGELVREAPLFAKYTLTDKDNSGQIDFEEFRDAQLRTFSELMMTTSEILTKLNDETRACILERQRMGPRFHTGIRERLRRIFQLYDTSGDACLSAEEWIAAQKIVALELSDDFDDSWINEAAFTAADLNKDGVLSEAEYLEACFKMFEVTAMNMTELMQMLENIVVALETKLGNDTTYPLSIWRQTKEKPDFMPPSRAWQNEPKIECTDEPSQEEKDGTSTYTQVGEIQLPTHLSTVAEVVSLVRLTCNIPENTWLSLYYMGPDPENPEGSYKPVTLLRDANTKAALDHLSKLSAAKRLYVKNVRARPKRLTQQSVAYLEDRENLLAKRTGVCWGIDWETQLVGAGSGYPRAGEVPIAIGDAVVIEIPTTDENQQWDYKASIWMDGTEVVSRPVEEEIVPKPKKKPKKPKKGAPVEEEKPIDTLRQMSFIGLQEGKCVVFVDISWEDQEGRLCAEHELGIPIQENTVARIGPIEIDVGKPAPKDPKAAPAEAFQWWNGDKWSNKKGPAKKKGKK
jgi:Ca2+-binding EF-hand superfamily protein